MATIRLTTLKRDVRITLTGSGTATIKWSDGKSDKYELHANNTVCTRSYLLPSGQPIIITGTFINLDCSQNDISSLIFSDCTTLANVWCQNNRLESLNVSACPKLAHLDCRNNSLSGAALNSLFTTLPTLATAATAVNLCITGNTGAIAGSGCNTATAANKRWKPDVSIVPTGLEGRIQLTTSKKDVKIILTGSGTATINWGDGKTPENFALTANNTTRTRSYASAVAHTITVTGAINTLNCSENQLTSLTLNNCGALSDLRCFNNNLKTLNISDCPNLTQLHAGANELTSLIFTSCTKLQLFSCYGNKLTSLNVSGQANLTHLHCDRNQLTSLNVNNCPRLFYLNCEENSISALSVTGNTLLETLNCSRNTLSALSVNGLANLTHLHCDTNKLTSLNVNNCPKLVYLDCVTNSISALSVTGNTLLETLRCSGNNLNTLSVNGLTKLRNLTCSDNIINRLDISNTSELYDLNCAKNQMQTITGLTGRTKLTYFYGSHNQLTSLSFSGCTQIEKIQLDYNDLNSLDINGCTKLKELDCTNNRLLGTALNALFAQLPTMPVGSTANLKIKNNPGATINTGGCNTQTATAKRWTVDFNTQTYDADRRAAINNYLKSIFLPNTDTAIQNAIEPGNEVPWIDNQGRLILYENVMIDDDVRELAVSSDRTDIYPGMLIVADSLLGTDRPRKSTLRRNEITISIELGTSATVNSLPVNPDSNGSLEIPVYNAINSMVQTFKNSGAQLTANFKEEGIEQCQESTTSISGGSASTILLFNKKKKTISSSTNSYSSYFMKNFSQVFFTATAQYNPNNLSSLFADSVTVDDLQREFSNKPVILVEKVRYGRQLHLFQEIKGSNYDMIKSFRASSFFPLLYSHGSDRSLMTSQSEVSYHTIMDVRGGDIGNALNLAPNVQRNSNETNLEFCIRQIENMQSQVQTFKNNYRSIDLRTGVVTSDVNGAVMSYTAKRLDGTNIRDAVFLKKGSHKMEKIIPNKGIKVKAFNTSGSHNYVVSGYYTKFGSNGQELPDVYDIHSERDGNGRPDPGSLVNVGTVVNGNVTLTQNLRDGGDKNWGRVYNQSFLSPEINLGKNIYRVYLKIRSRDDSKLAWTNTYILPCGDITAANLRTGKEGGETVNWYFGGNATESDEWYNGGKK